MLIGATPLFSITEIQVSGNNYYTKSQIVSKSGLQTGRNGFAALLGKNIFKVFSLRCADAEQAIASAFPYVKTVHARYSLPRTIVIEVEERSKSFIAPYFGSGLLIDGEGVVVDIIRDYGQSELPVAAGLSIKHYEIGKTLTQEDEAGIEAVIFIVNALRQADRDSDEVLAWNIEVIDVGDRDNMLLVLNNGITVNLGDGTELYYRVNAAKEIMAHGIGEGEEGAIVFSNGARPVFVPGGAAPGYQGSQY
jgi:cell division septal protein FtsQ